MHFLYSLTSLGLGGGGGGGGGGGCNLNTKVYMGRIMLWGKKTVVVLVCPRKKC